MGEFFVFLYPVVAIISLFAYIPQIRTLISTKSNCEEISLSSWYLWILGSGISLGYGIFHLQDFLFTLTCAISLILMSAVVALVLYRRQEWARSKSRIYIAAE